MSNVQTGRNPGGNPTGKKNRNATLKGFKLEKPEDKVYQEKMNEEQRAIHRIRDELDECAKRIKNLYAKKEKQNADFSKRKDKIVRVSNQIQELLKEKAAIRDALETKQQRPAPEVPAAPKKQQPAPGVPVTRSQSSIDAEIAQIERKMMTSTLSLKDEKFLVAKIDSLMLQKNENMKFSSKAPAQSKEESPVIAASPLDFDEAEIIPLKTRLEEIDVEISELRKERNREQKQATERPPVETIGSQIAEETEKRVELRAELRKHQEKKSNLYLSMKAEQQQYNEAYTKHLQEVQQKSREEKMKMQMESQRINLEQKLEAAEKVPSSAYLQILKQLRNLVQKYYDDRNNRDPRFLAKKSATEQVQRSGENVTSSETDSSISGLQDDKNSKMTARKNSTHKKEKATILRYDLQTLSYFDQFGISAPLREIDLDDCLIELDRKIAAKQAELDLLLKEKDAAKKALLEQLSTLEAKQIDSAAAAQ